MKDYYEILGLTRNPSMEKIKEKFIELSFENHPDITENETASEIFINVYEAYSILSDAELKVSYDLLHDKYFKKGHPKILNEEVIKNEIQNASDSAKEKAKINTKIKYQDFIKELDCFFSKGHKAEGKPFLYRMYKNIGISGRSGQLGSIKSEVIRIPVPRSMKALFIHRLGFLIKFLFFSLGVIILKFKLIPTTDIYSKMLILPTIILIGGVITHSIYHMNKSKSKFFYAHRYFLVKQYKQSGFKRGISPLTSVKPIRISIFILRVLF